MATSARRRRRRHHRRRSMQGQSCKRCCTLCKTSTGALIANAKAQGNPLESVAGRSTEGARLPADAQDKDEVRRTQVKQAAAQEM
jgi:hypothetical protein